jgi:hypothetical protein
MLIARAKPLGTRAEYLKLESNVDDLGRGLRTWSNCYMKHRRGRALKSVTRNMDRGTRLTQCSSRLCSSISPPASTALFKPTSSKQRLSVAWNVAPSALTNTSPTLGKGFRVLCDNL